MTAPKKKAAAKKTTKKKASIRLPESARTVKPTQSAKAGPRKASGGKKKIPLKKSVKKTAPKKAARKRPIPKYHINRQRWDRMEVMAVICEKITNSSLGLTGICENDKLLPVKKIIYDWLSDESKKGGETPLRDLYVRAKEDQADHMAEEMIGIADDGRNDYMERLGDDGKVIGHAIDNEHIQRSRLRVDTRKWIASKLKPKKYGDKLELSGDPERPLSGLSTDDLKAQIAALSKRLNES